MKPNLIDVHLHLIPGVDDGPESVRETLEMLKAAWAHGTRTLVATPHMFMPRFSLFDVDKARWAFQRMLERLEELSSEPRNKFLRDLEVFLGAENYVSTEFLEALDKGRVLPLHESRYVLIEFNREVARETALSAVDRMLQRGYFPVLAHVERYSFLQRRPKVLLDFIMRGCVAQVNGMTLTTAGGWRRKRLVVGWLREGWIGVVASDGHGTRARTPDLGAAWRELAALDGPRCADNLLRENPARLLAGRGLARVSVAPKKGLGSKLFP